MNSVDNREKSLLYFREMLKIRLFEQKAADLFSQGLMAGNIHTYVGQEAVAVGACQALERGDFITSTHRGHGHCLAKGGDPKKMMAELFGKAAGYCGGKGGSMHIADINLGILGANGIVGAGMPIAAGSALATKVKGGREVTLAFFGDGAANEGVFHETLNMASAWDLPVIFLCENNLYGISTTVARVSKLINIAGRAQAYGIPGTIADGNDVFAVHAAVSQAAERARQGAGPTLIECKTYRQRGHYEGDPQTYKPKNEAQAWQQRDPIMRIRQHILDNGYADAIQLGQMERDVQAEIDQAANFAQMTPYPAAETVELDMYTSDNERCVAR